MITEGMPIIFAPKNTDVDMGLLAADTDEGRAYRAKHFAQPKFVEAVKKYLVFLRKRGFLDVDWDWWCGEDRA